MSNWVKALIVGILLALLWGWHEKDTAERIAAAEKVLITSYQKKIDNSVLQAKKDTAAMQVDKDKSDAELQSKIKALDGNLSVALNELSKRPKRPSSTGDTPNDSKVASACTGAQLYREDGEFLIREASRAQAVLEERNYYYERYESVRRRLDEAANLE